MSTLQLGKPSRQVLRRAAIRARRMQRALRRAGHGIALTPLALVVGWAMSANPVFANPNGGQVVAGQATIQQGTPGTTNIFQQSQRAVVNWQGFSIGAGETVNFVQPGTGSVTLNRVLGNDPSAIFGQLNANGTVMLVNPNGIVFGPTARVDVGGLVATTSNIRDQDFMAGRYEFTQASPFTHASVENQGRISVKDSGLAALVAPRVRNSGVIEARLGRVALGAANTFTLDFHGDGLLSFGAGSAITAAPGNADALVVNSGEIRAEGGHVLLTARALKGVVDNVINTDGLIVATVVSGQGGRIVLSGGDAGQVAIGGTVDASAKAGGQGGTVVATGEHVRVAGGTRIDASGRDGGGEIALGSSGLTDASDTFSNKAATVDVAAGAQLRADATERGDGGAVTMWSKERTTFAGTASARGGAQGGDGGFAEVSSEKNIGLTGAVDLSAPKGATGTFLIDPTDLRITDTASGGSQDGNAADGSIASGDGNQGAGNALNTISRGLLESLSGNANIVLQATGQITVDAMAGGRIDFQTTTGRSVTLQSTQTGGIRFVDASTELRTQGGAIVLEALGIGSTLSNIGQLTSNGGAIALRATGDVQLAGNVDAGAGAVTVQSTVGSITNATGASPRLSGGSVALTAGGGSIGAAGSALRTHTARLGLEAGGSIRASNDMALTDLSVSALHVAPGTHVYAVDATGLDFQLADGSVVSATQIAQAGLRFVLTTDRSLQVGQIDVGSGTLSLVSTAGSLTGAAGNLATASAVTLLAQGSTGANGAIGSASQAVNTSAGTLAATSGSGGAYVANNGALALAKLATTGTSSVTATGTLTAGNVNTGSAALTLGSTTGSVLDDGDATTRIASGTLNVSAAGSAGTAPARLQTTAGTVNANAGAGGVYLNTTAITSTLGTIVSGNGAVDLTTGGTTTVGTITSGTSAAGNTVSVATTGTGNLTVGTINAGNAADVSLNASSGSILAASGGRITGDHLTARATGSLAVNSAAAHLDLQAGSNITVNQLGAVTLDNVTTTGSSVSVNSSSGNITVGTVRSAASGNTSLVAQAGEIVDDGNSATRLSTGTATLSSAGSIGTSANPFQASISGLVASSTGNLYLVNADNTLTRLEVTNRHATPGVANTLQITSPFLTFDVTDNGSQYALTRIVGAPLNTLAFTGDQTAVVGQVQGNGSTSITATQGDLLDDGNAQSRITGPNSVTLSAAQGHVGHAGQALQVNSPTLSLTTRGDLYVDGLADLTSLTLNSTHADATTSYGLQVNAPSLRFDVTDSATGHLLRTLTDTSGLALSFTSDRDITLGTVDLTKGGTATFRSTAGNILDDGDKTTRVLANSTSFNARAIGAGGANHLDVMTGTLTAAASAGGVYVDVPTPTGSSNYTNTLSLGTITAAGPVEITSHEGDVSISGNLTATNQAVRITADHGAILNPNGTVNIGTGSLTLSARDNIGNSTRALTMSGTTGSTVNAQAGTSIAIGSSGTVGVGTISATPSGTVTITSTGGSIVDDGNRATGITADSVTLTAASGSVGSASATLDVNAPKLAITATGAIAVDDSQTLTRLALTRNNGNATVAINAAGQTFALTEDALGHTLTQVGSASPLDFSFSGSRIVRVGQIDVGAAGSATLAGSNIVNAGTGNGITAGTVSLTANTAGSIGASADAIALHGTTALTASAGRNVFVTDDTALASLAITSTNTTTAAGTASQFGINAAGQSFAITDSGTTQSLDFGGAMLTNIGFTSAKNIEVGAIGATGDVTLTATSTGANSNITSDVGTGRITAGRVLLSTASSTAGGGAIGTSSRAVRIAAPTALVTGSAGVYLDDSTALDTLGLTLTHGTNTTFGYAVSASNINSFAVTDGNTQSLGLAVSGDMNFSYSVDRALSLATVDAGTSGSGSISLTSRSAPTGTNAQINRSSGTLTAGSIALAATGTNGGVGAAATLSTNTQNLSIASGGNVSVSNATTLTSLSLDAQHRTSGASTHSYAVSSTGLTFSIADNLSNPGFQLSNISQSGLNLSVKADRVITATSVNTGSGQVTLNSSSSIQGGSGANAGSPSITAGGLTLIGNSATGYQNSSTPLYVAVDTLTSTLTNTLNLSNAGNLTLLNNTVGGSATVATSSGSILQGTGALFSTPALTLNANQSIGNGTALQTSTRRMTLTSRGDINVNNATDLYSLDVTSSHATPGAQNALSIAADRLALTLTDSVGGNQYALSNLTDASGLDMALRTDVALQTGTVDAKAGRALALTTTGGSITNDGSSLLTAGSVSLSASGSVGAAGSSATRMQTDTRSLTVTTGRDALVDNAQDLTGLSLTSAQATGGTAPVYAFTAPSLTFDITDNGSATVNHVTDATGLSFTFDNRRGQTVEVIDLQRWGAVTLAERSGAGIVGSTDPTHRITAGSSNFTTANGGNVGTGPNAIRLSSPLTSFTVGGSLDVESDTHIDTLSIDRRSGTAGSYAIQSVPVFGSTPYALLAATDNGSATTLTRLADTQGLGFSFTSNRDIVVGEIDLGTTGSATLTNNGGSILGDGDTTTQVRASSLRLNSSSGSVGTSGVGNSIEATVNDLAVTANNGTTLNLHGRTSLGGVTSAGAVNLVNDIGDIALGSISAYGQTVTVNNQGGSILSGNISGTTTVSLTAQGSIGNASAIGLTANGGGTTTLTASAAAANGATGSVAISENWTLNASSVTGPGGVTLNAGYGLGVGTVTSNGAVALATSQGSITGNSGSNLITGSSVALTARYGTGAGLGTSGTALRVNTPQLSLATAGNVYVDGQADLNRLSIDRANYQSNTSSGTLSVAATNLTLNATDDGTVTTLTNLTDSTGLDFSYLGIGSIAVGTVNVGNAGSVLLRAQRNTGDLNGHITATSGSSRITAGSATLTAQGTGSTVGSSGTALGLSVGSLTASSGTGGMFLTQAGSLSLGNLATTGDLSVTATAGDLTLGAMSYGGTSALTLNATAGRILAGGGTLTGSSSASSVTLNAAHGIGTDVAPIVINASSGNSVTANVTGTGSLYLSSVGTMNGGLTTSVADGATQVTAAGNIRLASMTSGTDAAGNDINVTASAGNITLGTVSAGADARQSRVNLVANTGRILSTAGGSVTGYDVNLFGAGGVGDATNRVTVNGQRVQVGSNGGAIYLGAAAPSVLSSVNSNGGLINIATSADLLLANASSGGGAITVASTAANVELIAGNVDAGTGAVSITSTGTGGSVQDDGNALTRIGGGTVTLNGTAGVGSAQQAVQTRADTLVATSGTGVSIDDANTNGVNLANITANGGAVVLTTAGPTLATSVRATSDVAGRDVSITTTGGDLTVVGVSAGANNGNVSLTSSGSILASGSGTHVTGHSATLSAAGDIGTVTDLTTGAGTPLRINVASLDGLASTGANRAVSIDNRNTGAWVLGNSGFALGSGTSAYLRAAGDLDASGAGAFTGHLLLDAAGRLTLPVAAIQTTGDVQLSGGTDVVTAASGSAARTLQVGANSLRLRSGAAGGDVVLSTAVNTLDASLGGTAGLTVNNTGTLTSASLQTANGDIQATSSNGLGVDAATAGGANRTIALTASAGDLTVGTLNAGANGTLTLSSANGSLTADPAALTARTLNLTSGTAIGSANAAFDATGRIVDAQVTGTGGIHLDAAGPLTVGTLATQAGDIAVNTTGALTSTGAVNASGNVAFTGPTIVLNGGSVSSTGTQAYTGDVTLGANTTLAGSSVTLQGAVDAATAGAASLAITGNAAFGGPVGANAALSGLSVTGSTQLHGDVITSGTQSYGGALVVDGNTTLHGSAGSLVFGSTIDAATAGANLSLRADAGSIAVTGNVGQTGALGALTLRSGSFTTFNGSVQLGSLVQAAAGGLTTLGGALAATDVAGVQFSGAGFVFGGDVNSAGALAIAVTDPSASVQFAAGSTVQAATGFTQTGGAAVRMPAVLRVTQGDISVAAPATLQGATTRIETQGDITMSGLVGATTALTMNAGTGAMAIGSNDASADHKIVVGSLSVQTAGSATMYGTIGGQAGTAAASSIDSLLFNAPYFINDTPWSPRETPRPLAVVSTLAAVTAPHSVVPSTPGVQSLFSREVVAASVAPDALKVFGAPQVLTLSTEPRASGTADEEAKPR